MSRDLTPTRPEDPTPVRTTVRRGMSLGRYIVLDRIGQGGMGTDHNLAETRLALAQAILATGGDRARARDLLVAARKAYASYGDRRRQELVEVDAALRKL